MFKSKKNTLPPRPPIPSYKEILEDLNNLVSSNDIAFKMLEKGIVLRKIFVTFKVKYHFSPLFLILQKMHLKTTH